MADSKVADLTAVTSLGGDELLYVVDDPGGTPVDRKITATNLLNKPVPLLGKLSGGATLWNSSPGAGWTANTGTQALVADRLYYCNFFDLNAKIRVTAGRLNVSSLAASSTVRFGLVAVGQDGQPSSLIVDCGAVDSGSTGLKAVTGLTSNIGPGRFAWCLVSNGTPTLRYSPNGPAVGIDDTAGTTVVTFGFINSQSSQHTALGNPPTAWTGVGTGSSPFNFVQMQWTAQP